MTIPNLTSDLVNEALGAEPIRDCDFTVTVTAGDRQFRHIAAAVTEWSFQEVLSATGVDYFDDDDPDYDADDEEEEDDEAYLFSLKYRVTLNVIQEIQDIRELCEEDPNFELNVSVVYHTATTKKPAMRHTFSGYPTVDSSFTGCISSTKPLEFDLQLDCTKCALSIRM
jgi:hypothetical protein